MSNDWWQSTSYSTPQRPLFQTQTSQTSYPNNSLSGPSRSRFAGDELDADDAKAADNIRFAPSFAASPVATRGIQTGYAGSPVATTSPPAARRSPSTRFSMSGDAASPRNLRSSRTFPTFDTEDAPPTLSLRDSDASTPSSQPSYPLSSSSSHSSHQLPLPPALMASAQTTTLQVFGPPSDQLPHLRQWLEQCGPIKSYSPGPQGSNWFVVEFETPTGASFALRKHGEVIAGKWMVGFKVASGGALESYTPINNGEERGGEIVQSGGIGTPIRVQNTSIVKQKPQAPKKTGEGYAWEETEQPSGIINKAAEWFFGR